METKEQKFYGKIIGFEETEKYIESKILHFGVVNENRWTPMSGCLDAFFDRLNKSKKGVAACYQHDESLLIGVWRDFVVNGNELSGKLYFVETPFVKDTVIPQLKAGILQGASPTIATVRDSWNQSKNTWEILEGILCEISLVGLPADFKADVISMRASIEAKTRETENFDFDLLTL